MVRLLRQGLEVSPTGGPTQFWPYTQIRQTQGFYTGEEVRLERGGNIPEVLLIADLGFLQSLHEVAPEPSARFHNPARRGRRRRLTILAAVAVIGSAAVMYLFGIPALAARAAIRVPVSWEERLGNGAVAYLAPPERRCEDPRLTAAIQKIVDRLMKAAPPSPYTIRVYVTDSLAFNAFAAPGGTVVVYRGLVERTDSPEQLAGVLAHELQHVLNRHATRGIIQHASSGLLIAALTGDMTGPLTYGLEAGRLLGQMRYSRGAEEEADTEGLKMLLAARVDPEGIIGFFELLRKKEGSGSNVLQYLSTHPTSRERMAALRALATQHPIEPVKLLPQEDWSEIRNLCGSSSRRVR
jgi:predicted Zn-dependent protease